MPVIINGSTGISGTDGSAGTPAVQGTDTNTGMFFPAADQIAFAEGGVEAMRLDASGNVGIGTSSPSSYGNGLVVFNAATGVIRAAGGSVTSYMFASNAGGVAAVGTESNHPLTLYTNNAERARITTAGDFQFNSGYGSVATAFGCRAWVNFNGSGTVSIRASGNVSSITDNGVGQYTLNFTTAMPNTNYAITGNVGDNGLAFGLYPNVFSYTTSSAQVVVARPGTGFYDIDHITAAVFR